MMSVWTAKPGPRRTGARGLLGQHHVVAEVLDAGAAVLLLDVEAQQPGLAGLAPHLADTMPSFSHCAWKG